MGINCVVVPIIVWKLKNKIQNQTQQQNYLQFNVFSWAQTCIECQRNNNNKWNKELPVILDAIMNVIASIEPWKVCQTKYNSFSTLGFNNKLMRTNKLFITSKHTRDEHGQLCVSFYYFDIIWKICALFLFLK